MEGEELLTVIRGSLVTEEERIAELRNKILQGKIKESEMPGLIKKIKEEKWNYGGTFYSV